MVLSAPALMRARCVAVAGNMRSMKKRPVTSLSSMLAVTEFAERPLERCYVGRHRRVGLLDVAGHLGEERLQGAAAVFRQFAADQIEGLNPVGAFVNHGDTRIAQELLHAV